MIKTYRHESTRLQIQRLRQEKEGKKGLIALQKQKRKGQRRPTDGKTKEKQTLYASNWTILRVEVTT